VIALVSAVPAPVGAPNCGGRAQGLHFPGVARRFEMSDRNEGDTGWRFWIDRGGTFVDVIARAPDGRLRATKLLASDLSTGEDANLRGQF